MPSEQTSATQNHQKTKGSRDGPDEDSAAETSSSTSTASDTKDVEASGSTDAGGEEPSTFAPHGEGEGEEGSSLTKEVRREEESAGEKNGLDEPLAVPEDFSGIPRLRVGSGPERRLILLDLTDGLAHELGLSNAHSLTGQQEDELADLVGPHLEPSQKCIDRRTLREIVAEERGESENSDSVKIAGLELTREGAAMLVVVFGVILLLVILVGVIF